MKLPDFYLSLDITKLDVFCINSVNNDFPSKEIKYCCYPPEYLLHI